MRPVVKGSTDQSVVIRIIDATDGTPEQAVEHNTSGISLWYRREGATITAITPAALAALDTAHSDGGIEHIDDGYYRLDLPDAACATGVNGVMVGGAVTGMIVVGCYVTLVDVNPYDGVRAGMTALPNAAADAAGGLPISDAGGLDLDGLNTNVSAILADTGTDGVVVATGSKTGYSLATGPLDAAGVRTAVGLASANLDTQLSALPTDADVQTAAAAALTAYDPPTKAELDAAVAPLATSAAVVALNDLSAAEVNAEVVDALSTDTYDEPGQGAPPKVASIATKIGYEYKAWRNKTTSDADSIDLFNDAGDTVDQKATISDNETTFTRGEMGSGA